MKKSTENLPIRAVGIDLGKTCFQIHAVNVQGKKELNKKLSRKQLRTLMAMLPPCVVGMEACASAHF